MIYDKASTKIPKISFIFLTFHQVTYFQHILVNTKKHSMTIFYIYFATLTVLQKSPLKPLLQWTDVHYVSQKCLHSIQRCY